MDIDASTAAGHKGRLVAVLALTTAFLAVEVAAGLLTGSLALLADAGHMATDVAGLALALAAVWFGGRPATPERTYGYHRAEILAAAANALALGVVSASILYEAYGRLLDPPAVASGGMMAVAVAGLAVNLAGMAILRPISEGSLNMKGAYFEVLSDALASVGVIVAAAIMWATGWYYADPLFSAAIGVFIVPRAWSLLAEAVHVLLEGTPSGVDLAAVRESLAGVEGVDGVHDLHAWSLTSGVNALSAHLAAVEGADHASILAEARRRVVEGFPIAHATIQVEPPGWPWCDAAHA